MENTTQEITISFVKTKLKDLLIHQIATHLQQHWTDNEVIELFLDSPFNFVEEDKTKAQVVSALMETHKVALQKEINLEVKI
jgi:hypothetical protein